MARRPVIFSSVTQSARALRHWFSFAAMTLFAFGLMLLSAADIAVIDRVRTAATNALVPILETLSQPARLISGAVSDIGEWYDMRGELTRLRAENARLRKWQSVATGIAAENQALQRLSRLSVPPAPRYVTGRIISNSGGPFVRSVLVNAGRRDGLRPGLAAVAEAGFVGTVVEAGERYARVLLLTDLNSQIPVIVQTTRDPGVLAGDNSNRPRLLFLPQEARVSAGAPVVTSGSGGVLPAGLLVGVITAVSDTDVRVKPLVDWARLEYVRVLDYQLAGVVETPHGAGGLR